MKKLEFLNHGVSNIHAAALLLGAAGFLSKLLGVLRDRLLAAHFGAGRELDIYYAAFQVPDFVLTIFLLGGASSAILPVFQEYIARDRAKARRLISQLATLFVIGASALCILVFFLAPFLMRFVAPGFSGEELDRVVALTRLMLLSPILFGLSGILSAVVETFRRFVAYALSSVFYNLGIIIGIVAIVPFFGLWGLGVGIVLGAVFNFLTYLFPVIDLGFAPYLSWDGVTDGIKRILRISVPRVFSVSVSQLTSLALVAYASTLPAGSIAVFALAQNLYFMPIGVFAIGYTVAIFPRMSRAYIEKNGHLFFYELFLGIRSILFWIIPSAVLFIVLRAHIVRVALGAGAFSWEDTRLTAALLATFMVALTAGGLVSFFVKGFYALENTWYSFVVNIFGSIASVLLSVFLARTIVSHSALGNFISVLFRIQDLPHPEVVGLGLGFALGLIVNVGLLYVVLIRFARKKFPARVPFPFIPLVKIIVAAVVSGSIAYGVRAAFSDTLPLVTFTRVLIQGLSAGITGVVVYFAVLFVLRSEDALALWRSLETRLLKIGILPKSWNGVAHETVSR